MHGIIGRIIATPGNRDRLIEILLEGTADLPGCELYSISASTTDDNEIWINEIWTSEAAHQASLQLPAVQNAISEGKPLIAGFGERHVVTPRGGWGVS